MKQAVVSTTACFFHLRAVALLRTRPLATLHSYAMTMENPHDQ